jgi:hypothetical protein
VGQEIDKQIDNFRYESGPATINATSLSGSLIAALFSFLTALARGLFNSLRAVFSGSETK